MTNEELNKSVEGALNAFNEYKGMVEELKTTVTSIQPKMDAFDEAKLRKLEKSIGDAVELQQKEQARLKALEEQTKGDQEAHEKLEKELSELKTAYNRAPAAQDTKAKAEELAAKRNKLFNEFARSKGKEEFSDFLAKHMEEDPELKTLSVGSDPNGGYLVMPDWGGLIRNRVFESSPIRELASVQAISTDALEIAEDNDEAAAGWVSESGTRSTTGTPTIGKLNFPTHELYALPKITTKLLEDAVVDIEAWLMEKVADIFARTEATAFVSGSGTGKPRGFLTYTAGTTVTSHQIEQVNSQAAADFTYKGLVRLQNALKEPYQSNAVFVFKRASNINLMELTDGIGRPILNMGYDKNVGLQATLMNQPYRFADDMPAVSAGNLAMAYGDFRAGYQIVDRKGISVLRDPYSSKGFVEFFTTKRVGGGVKNYEAIKLQKISA